MDLWGAPWLRNISGSLQEQSMKNDSHKREPSCEPFSGGFPEPFASHDKKAIPKSSSKRLRSPATQVIPADAIKK